MRLLNRAAQRYLLWRPTGPVVGVPGIDPIVDTDWDIADDGDAVSLAPSGAPGVGVWPLSSSLVVGDAPSRTTGWVLQRADAGFHYLASAQDPGVVLAVDETGQGDRPVALQNARDEAAMWMLQPSCVADARSIHLRYASSDPANLFYNEVYPLAAPPGTFFCVIGFGADSRLRPPSGYVGIQQLGDDKQIAIFSVWHRMVDEIRVARGTDATVVACHEDAVTTVFGGEGAGASIRLPYSWHTGMEKPYRIAVTAEPLERDTVLSAYIASPRGPWVSIGSIIRARTNGALLSHCYSFVEDFMRNGDRAGVPSEERSPYRPRRAVFSEPWRWGSGRLEPIMEVKVTAYSPHPLENIAAHPTNRLPGFAVDVATGTGALTRPSPIGATIVDRGSRDAPNLDGVPYR